jgi:polysaccharide biosynthesis transport protein
MSMADDRLSLPDETDSQSGALLPVNAMSHGNGDWNGIALNEPSAGPAKTDVMVYFHAVRRHWLLSLGIGLPCAVVAALAVYFGMGERYTAYSVLHISMQENQIFSSSGTPLVDRDRFEIYKNSQMTQLLQRMVLMAALNKPEVKNIPIVQYKTLYSDPAEWLAGKISVSFPQKAEVMMVSLSLEDPEEAKSLVNAVVDSYMSEVVNAENERKRKRYDELERICGDKETQIRAKREELKSLVATAGVTDSPDSWSIRQRLVLEELALYRSELARGSSDISKARGELASQEALRDNADVAAVPQMELDYLVQTDPVAKQISVELGWKKIDEQTNQSAAKAGSSSPYVTQSSQLVKKLQEQYDERIKVLEKKAREKSRSKAETEIVRLKALLKPIEDQQKAMKNKLAEREEQAKTISQSTVDVQMVQAQLRNWEQVLGSFVNERERLGVDIKSAPRILVSEKAEKPLMPSNTTARIALTCLAVLTSLCLPVVGVALWDTRTHRINTTADVSQGLRLPVIGSMPLVPARVIRQLGSPSPRHRSWHLRLTESVDGIAARLLRKADVEQSRVIMVSSATGGEGKTTLATQLALSLARTGRRTILVDFDLRRPSFDEMFGMPLSPGVCESLRHECDVDALVHPVAADNLAVITAGRWDRQALASLSNGSVDALFRQLREDFDFVVVDTSPILPVADARFVSQYVDSVVLSVFRDVSEAPKIQAACDILAAFGAHCVEAVVTGPGNGLYGRHVEYQSTVSAS